MKRLKRVLGYAIGGVLATVATCWTVAFVVPVGGMTTGLVTPLAGVEPSMYQSGLLFRSKVTAHLEANSKFWNEEIWGPHTRLSPGEVLHTFPAWSVTVGIQSVDKIRGRYDLEHAFGWPCLAMSAHWLGDRAEIGGGGGAPAPPPIVLELKNGIEVSSCWTKWIPFKSPPSASLFSLKSVKALPTRILPLGFAANTAANAAFMFLLVSTGRFCRRRLRRKRGLCAVCAYDLRGGGHGQCPECGVPLNSAD